MTDEIETTVVEHEQASAQHHRNATPQGRTPRGLKTLPAVDPVERVELLARACHAAGIPATSQRKSVLMAVLELQSHPTADDICQHLSTTGLQISRATVFRTLETLVELDLIAKTCHPGRGVRYDHVNTAHHHLVCLSCNELVDFIDDGLDALTAPDTSSVGFRVVDCRVQVRGICRKCQSKSA
jgi:Fur family peroxide stress response transcriptional regulator